MDTLVLFAIGVNTVMPMILVMSLILNIVYQFNIVT